MAIYKGIEPSSLRRQRSRLTRCVIDHSFDISGVHSYRSDIDLFHINNDCYPLAKTSTSSITLSKANNCNLYSTLFLFIAEQHFVVKLFCGPEGIRTPTNSKPTHYLRRIHSSKFVSSMTVFLQP